MKNKYKRKNSRKKKNSLGLTGVLVILVIAGLIKAGTNDSLPDTQTTEAVTVQAQDSTSQTDAIQMSSEEAASLAEAHINTALEAFANETIPEYSGNPYVELNGNVPYFTDEELSTTAFELYSELDSLGMLCQYLQGDNAYRGERQYRHGEAHRLAYSKVRLHNGQILIQ